MASMYGYAYLIVGLSVLLGLAGIASGAGGLMNMFVQMTTNPITGEVIMDFTTLNQFLNDFWGTWQSLLVIGSVIVGVGIAVATKDFGQGLKASMATAICGLVIGDFISIMGIGADYGSMGIVITIISWVVYIPLAIGMFIAVSNWIQGRD